MHVRTESSAEKTWRRRCQDRLRSATTLVVLTLLAALIVIVVSPAASAGISDDSIAPSWTAIEIGFGASEDHADAVALAAGGVTYVAGWAGNASGNDDITLAKYVNGVTDPVWGGKKTWDSPSHSLDQGHGVATGPNGAVYTVGSAIHGRMRAVVIKWSAATGEIVWVRYFGATTGAVSHWGENIGIDRRGNVVVASTCEIDGKRDWYAVSWSPSGKRRWSWRPGSLTPDGTDCYLAGLAVARDGTTCLTGRQSDGKQITTVRLSGGGKRLWARRYAASPNLWVTVHDVASRPQGGVYLCGSVEVSDTKWAGLVVRYTATGARGVFALDTEGDSLGYTDVAVAADGSVVAAGYEESGWLYPRHAVYRPNGAVVRHQTIGSGSMKRLWTGVATDAFGGLYTTACTRDAGGHGRIETRRFPVTFGGLWTGLYQPYPAQEWTEPTAIAVRGSTVVVVGYTDTGGPSGEDQVTVGYTY